MNLYQLKEEAKNLLRQLTADQLRELLPELQRIAAEDQKLSSDTCATVATEDLQAG